MQINLNLYRIIILIVISMLMSGCSIFPSEEETLAPPLVVPEEITYKTVEVKNGYIENSIKGTATFVPFNEKNIFFESSGRLKELYVELGDKLKKGDLIAELLIDDIDRQIAGQEILVDSKENDLNYTQSIADIEIKMCQDKISELQKKYDDMNSITDAYSTNEIEGVKNELESQKNLLEKTRFDLANQLVGKKNDVKSARLTLEGIRKDREKSRLLSPVDGIVTYTASMKAGEDIDAYKTIVTIAQPGELRLKYTGLEAYKFELGMKIEVEIDSGEKCTGEVVLTENSVSFEEMEKYKETVLIKVDKLPEGVERGERADIKLILKSADDALIIPKSAIRQYMGRNIVYVLEEDLRVERYIEIGIESISEIQVLEGVEAGEKVIVE